MKLTILCVVLACGVLPSYPAAEAELLQEGEAPTIIDLLRAEFQHRNEKVEVVNLLDLAPLWWKQPAEYLVLARGIRADYRFEGSFDDELFGLFVVDSNFGSVRKVLDVFPTPRWNDFVLKIERIEGQTVVIVGEGATYGDGRVEKRYDLSFPERERAADPP